MVHLGPSSCVAGLPNLDLTGGGLDICGLWWKYRTLEGLRTLWEEKKTDITVSVNNKQYISALL